MTSSVFRLGVVKLGCVGAAPLLDLIFDERAARTDIAVRAWTSGAKLDPDSCIGPVEDALRWKPELVVLVSPNAALPGPTQARESLVEAGIPVVAIGDSPSKKAFYKKNEAGKQEISVPDNVGFMILPCDPMIGARSEFLDPTEMVLFNADVIRLLSAAGVIRTLQEELDALVSTLRSGDAAKLPKLSITADRAVDAAGFQNPYAASKAFAALKIAESVAGVTTRACFAEKDPAKYVPMVSAGHEMMRAAARLADEARELEKGEDSILRTPHSNSGDVRRKNALGESPA